MDSDKDKTFPVSQIPKISLATTDFAVIAGCIILIVMGTLPVLFSFSPSLTFGIFSQSQALETTGKTLTVLFFIVVIFFIAKADSAPVLNKFFLYAGFLLLSFFLTDFHYYTVDVFRSKWQIDQYIGILAGQYAPPYQYRFLSHGILWWIVRLNGDFLFSYLTYRWFFTFVLCLCIYRFSRLYNSHKDSLLVVLIYAILYPFSIRYYYGNILDPMFHSVFIVTLMYCQRKKFWPVFCLLGLGMLIKEPVVLAVPCYYLLNTESLRLFSKKVVLALLCLTAWCLLLLLACRIPFGFRFNFETFHGISCWMIMSNLGFPPKDFVKLVMPVYNLYLHPFLFIFMWLPGLILYRKFLSRSLFYTSIYLGVSVYLTNLCFGWNYESRNFIPALIVLVVATAAMLNRKSAQKLTAL